MIPLSHSYGLGSLVMPLLLQGTAIVLRGSFVPHQLPSDARRFGDPAFPGVPFMFQYFIAHPPADGWPSCLTRLVSAGARLDAGHGARFHERFGVKIHSFYGTTETGGITFDDGDEIDGSVPVGHGVARRDDYAPARSRRARRLRARPRAERRRLRRLRRQRRRRRFADGGFLTGDYGAFDVTGRLMLSAASPRSSTSRDERSSPRRVERVLQAMPCVADVRVLAAPDAQRGQQIVACVVPAGGPALTPSMSAASARERLAPHKVPRAIVVPQGDSRSPSRGKTDRAALEDAHTRTPDRVTP